MADRGMFDNTSDGRDQDGEAGLFDNSGDLERRTAPGSSKLGTGLLNTPGTSQPNTGTHLPDQGPLPNTSNQAAPPGGSGSAATFSNTSASYRAGGNQGGSSGAGMFDNAGDTETRPGDAAGTFDNSGASETRSGGGAGMFDNEGDGNRGLGAGEETKKEKGVKGIMHKVKQSFIPGPD